MKNFFTAGCFLSLSLVILIAGCASVEQSKVRDDFTEGKVIHVLLEGGFYGIAISDTVNLFPVNLPEPYKKQGLKIRFSFKPVKKVNSTVMWGTPIEILSIEKK